MNLIIILKLGIIFYFQALSIVSAVDCLQRIDAPCESTRLTIGSVSRQVKTAISCHRRQFLQYSRIHIRIIIQVQEVNTNPVTPIIIQ